MTLVLRYSARSDRGLVRQNNQDAVYAGPRLLALADGMGGHAAGEVASSLVISALAPLDEDDPGDDLLAELREATVEGNAAITRHVMMRDATCRFPGCRQPARRCDLDHIQPWPIGPTAAGNLIALCRRHHRLKHSSRWQVTAAASGAVTWISPTGRKYTTHPPPIAPPT